ncbi:hypothetical protein B484DRAFT_405750, partial [Ochromonadaceae sp. CCMP2298]
MSLLFAVVVALLSTATSFRFGKTDSSLNREYHLVYEHQIIQVHREQHPLHVVYHWSRVPEDVLYKSGFVQDSGKLRQSRKKHREARYGGGSEGLAYFNPVGEYGLDGIAVEPPPMPIHAETETSAAAPAPPSTYHGLQAKCYSGTICASDLGTFLVASDRLRRRSPLSRGYLYYTGRLQADVATHFAEEPSYRATHVPFDTSALPPRLPSDRTADNTYGSVGVQAQQGQAQWGQGQQGQGQQAQRGQGGRQVQQGQRQESAPTLWPFQEEAVAALDCWQQAQGGAPETSEGAVGGTGLLGGEGGYVSEGGAPEANVGHMGLVGGAVGLLHLPCGTGKTLVAGTHINHAQYCIIVVMSPTRVLAQQNLERLRAFLPHHEALLVDSDEKGTRDVSNIRDRVAEAIAATAAATAADATADAAGAPLCLLISATYASCRDVLLAALFGGDGSLPVHSLLIVDEAHNLRQEDLVAFAQRFPNVLLLTATPPRQMSEVIPHRLVFNYPMAQAIEQGYVCDYEVLLPLQFMKRAMGAQNQTRQAGGEVPLLAHDGDAVDADYVDVDDAADGGDTDCDSGGEESWGAEEVSDDPFFGASVPVELLGKGRADLVKKALFLANGMLRTGSRRCIVYFASQQECADFSVTFQTVMDDYHYHPCWTGLLVDKTRNRDSVLEDFISDRVQQEHGVTSDPSALRVLASVRILDEGVDLPACDS